MTKYAGYKLALIAALMLHWPVLAQDQASEEPPDTEGEVAGELPEPEGDGAADGADDDATSDDGTADDEVIDDSDLDEQVYEEDEDDFIPSEEIPVDEAIPFPIDI